MDSKKKTLTQRVEALEKEIKNLESCPFVHFPNGDIPSTVPVDAAGCEIDQHKCNNCGTCVDNNNSYHACTYINN